MVDEITFRIRHTRIPVRDLDRSVDFYTRLLGMEIQRLRNAPAAKERVAYVGYGSEDDFPALELIEFGGPYATKELRPWDGHIAIDVSDLYRLSEKLKSAEVKFTVGPEPNRAGSSDHVAFIEDPDGYTIELNEWHTITSKKPSPV